MECLPLAHFEHVVPSRWRCLRLYRKYVTVTGAGFESLQACLTPAFSLCFLLMGEDVILWLPTLATCCHSSPTVLGLSLWYYKPNKLLGKSLSYKSEGRGGKGNVGEGRGGEGSHPLYPCTLSSVIEFES